MARRKSSKKSRPLPDPFAPLAEFEWGSLITHASTIGTVVLFIVLAVTWLLGVPRLHAYASAHEAVGKVEVQFVDRPAWMRGDLEASLVQAALGRLSGDPLDRAGLTRARQALLETGWFESIEQVRRVRPDLVEVRATFEHPFAVIRDGAGDHLVSLQGRLLPRTFGRGEAGRFIAITGTRFSRPSSVGRMWEGEDVTSALRLLRLVYARPWRDQIGAIDVSAYLSEGLVLVTDRGCRIRFGRAPGAETAGEVSAEKKIGYLDYHYEQYGHVDRGFPSSLDVTGDVVIGR